MKDIRQLTLEEAELQLKMNVSLIEMLKKDTPIEVIAQFWEMWVEPLEWLVRELKTNNKGKSYVIAEISKELDL